jgi:hypothetical protein
MKLPNAVVKIRKTDSKAGTIKEVAESHWVAYSRTHLTGEGEAVRYTVRRIGAYWTCNCPARVPCWHVILILRTKLRNSRWKVIQFRQSMLEARRQKRKVLTYYYNKKPFYAVVGRRTEKTKRILLEYEQYTTRGMGFQKMKLKAKREGDDYHDSKLDWVKLTSLLIKNGYRYESRGIMRYGSLKRITERWVLC